MTECQKQHDGVNQWSCARCGTFWGENDQDPPECITDSQLGRDITSFSVDRSEIYKTGAKNAREAIRGKV